MRLSYATTGLSQEQFFIRGGRKLLVSVCVMESGMDAESILEALVNGEAIEAPQVKKRGRKKNQAAGA